MAMVKNVFVQYASVDPEHPSHKYKNWVIVGKTDSEEQQQEWKSAGLKVKKAFEKDEDGEIVGGWLGYWTISISSKAFTNAGKPMDPPAVVKADLRPVERPDTIGRGSMVNIHFNQKPNPEGGFYNYLSGVQVIKHVVRESNASPFEAVGETTVVSEEEYKETIEKTVKAKKDKPKKVKKTKVKGL